MITGLEHIGIYTKDIETTKKFYLQGLGFTETWDGLVDTGNGFTHASTVRLGSCILELVMPPDKDLVNSVWGPVQHIALHVDDLEATITSLSEKGIEIKENPSMITYEGGVYHAFIYGPSNERIELVEKRSY